MNDEQLSETIIESLKTIYDPEIPVNIVDLGLIYSIKVQKGHVEVQMTLTNPGCPVAGEFPGIIKSHLSDLKGIQKITVELIWEPAWTTDRMSQAAKLQLGILE
jgi:FeS assembly SUF system protein